eukprot:TRINITY_DN36720_c0_g1_i1.p1 TRINITY_DN36720_c0_g1~~TRINITY_DN36720_c0_g1_i1.p1  ORF type:complete len:820 (-),score=179.70 TRINITY_DN36720_c0_g1_i1:144-2603(-)
MYLDLLACLGSDISFEEFSSRGLWKTGQVKAALQKVCNDKDMCEQLWHQLHGHITLRAVVAEPDMAQYLHVRSAADYVRLVNSLNRTREPITQTFFFGDAGNVDPSSYVVNSLLGTSEVKAQAVVENCNLEGDCCIGERAVCSGVRRLAQLRVPSDLCLQQIAILGGGFCMVTFTAEDGATLEDYTGTFMGYPWPKFLEGTGIDAADLWLDDEPHTLTTARLFPVVEEIELGSLGVLWLELYQDVTTGPRSSALSRIEEARRSQWQKSRRVSLAEVTNCADIAAEFAWQRQLAAKTSTARVRNVLLARHNEPLGPIISEDVGRGCWDLLDVFDDIAADKATAPDIAARALAQIAEVLAAFAGSEGGLRSGNARHPQWRSAIQCLGDVGNPVSRQKAVLELRALRQQWISDGPVALIRMARHYEAAAQMLIRTAVDTASQFMKITTMQPRPVGDCVSVDAPARIDIAGGWTDTPPVAYENGGAVTNLAVLVDGQRPIGARAKRIAAFELIFEIADSSENTSSPAVVCRELDDLSDYNRPAAPAALLKASVLCCGAVELFGAGSLAEQLEALGGGLHVTSWSRLPQGSGLGTSSILAGVVMYAISEALGRRLDQQSLIHAVLKVEQMMTTGGGWQDQVGGLVPGAKIARSAASLPLQVLTEEIPVRQEVAAAIAERLVLVFTGHPRLAKSLLQNVLRRWYARLPEICEVVGRLTANAEEAARALREGNLEKLGQCLSTYWEHKKLMAAGCEPKAVAVLRERLAPQILGFSLAGAGGGGFAVVLMREANRMDCVREALVGIEGLEDATLHSAAVDLQGMAVR